MSLFDEEHTYTHNGVTHVMPLPPIKGGTHGLRSQVMAPQIMGDDVPDGGMDVDGLIKFGEDLDGLIAVKEVAVPPEPVQVDLRPKSTGERIERHLTLHGVTGLKQGLSVGQLVQALNIEEATAYYALNGLMRRKKLLRAKRDADGQRVFVYWLPDANKVDLATRIMVAMEGREHATVPLLAGLIDSPSRSISNVIRGMVKDGWLSAQSVKAKSGGYIVKYRRIVE